jgi:hypothetical protein
MSDPKTTTELPPVKRRALVRALAKWLHQQEKEADRKAKGRKIGG